MFCMECGSQIADDARYCPICQTPMATPAQQPFASGRRVPDAFQSRNFSGPEEESFFTFSEDTVPAGSSDRNTLPGAPVPFQPVPPAQNIPNRPVKRKAPGISTPSSGGDPYPRNSTPQANTPDPGWRVPDSPIPRKPTPPQRPAEPPQTPAAPAPRSAGKKPDIVIIVGIILAALLVIFIGIMAVSFLIRILSPGEEAAVPTLPAVTAPPPAESVFQPEEPADPNPVPASNPYRNCYDPQTGFVLPESSTRYYSLGEIYHLTDDQLTVAEAEISARHGGSVKDVQLQEYLSCMSWYPASGTAFTLNAFEEGNLRLIEIYRQELDGSLYRNGNPYLKYLDNSTVELLPNSGTRYLKGTDLKNLSPAELVLARNEIFARNGYVFTDRDLQEYFYCKKWYTPDPYYIKDSLNDPEIANIELIGVYERIADGITPSRNNPYIPYYSSRSEYILPEGSNRELDMWDLQGYTSTELCIARNQIIARHGYTFSDVDLLDYFLQCSWYEPNTSPGKTDQVSLSNTERNNMNFILEYEQKLDKLPDLSRLDTTFSASAGNDFLSVKLPKYWDSYCIIKETSSNGAHYLRFSEKFSNEAYDGGHLFTIALLPTTEDYTYYPAYDTLGSLVDVSGNCWNIVTLYPTDVQAFEPYGDLYQRMYRDIDSILATMTIDDSCNYYSTMFPIDS